MPPLPSRMTKNQPRNIRYRPGKAEVEDQDSDEESSEEEHDNVPPVQSKPAPKATSFPSHKKIAVDLSKADQQVSVPPTQPAKAQDDLDGFVTASESSESEVDDGSSDEVQGDSDVESEESSSDDEPKKSMLAPKFIPKAKRMQQAPDIPAEDQAAEQERLRKVKADAMLQTQLERDAAARAAGKKFWDDDDNIADDEPDTDDEKDFEEAKAAWKLRELKRVRRERLAIEEKEKEREEIERRRNLTAEEREAEDRDFIAKQNEEREGEGGRGKMAYMQKYFHKGAFFDGDEEGDEEVKAALNRNLAGARFVDETGDKAVLPEYMRIRDMTQLGRKGRTKYKDLKNEDTGRWGTDVGSRKRESDDRGLDERFRADDHRGEGGRERTGANNAPLGKKARYE